MADFIKQVLTAQDQNVSSGDVNLIGAFALQNLKNFNFHVMSQADCVIAGLQVVAPALPTTGSVTVNTGYALYCTPNATTTVPNSNPTIALSYKGSVIEITANLSVTISSPDPTNDRIDAIDLIYTEIGGVPSSRNFINPGTGSVSLQTTNTETLGNSVQAPGSSNTNILYTQGTPAGSPVAPAIPANAIRLATIRVVHGAGFNIIQNNITQAGASGTSGVNGTLPRLFDLQEFPTNANAIGGAGINKADQSNSLSDSLSAIRYQLNQIITNGVGNWFNAIPISLPQLLIWGGTDTGSANVYAVTITNFPTTLTAGLRVFFNAANGNTGASTISINGGPAKTIKDAQGLDLAASTIQPGQRVLILFDGTNWIMPYVNVGLPTQSPFEIPNGSFEKWSGTTPVNWTTPILTGSATVTQDTTNFIDGASSLKVTVPNTTVGTGSTTSAFIPIGPQNTYYIKFKTQASQANAVGQVQVTYYNSSKVIIGSAVNLWTPPAGVWPTTWTTFYGIVADNSTGSALVAPSNVVITQIPTNASYLTVTVTSGYSSVVAGNQFAWFDGVQFFQPGRTSSIFQTSTAGTYTVVTPGNAIEAFVTLVAGGGGGGGGGANNGGSANGGGGGGGAGGTVKAAIPVNPDTVYTLIVGGAGGGGSRPNNNPGTGGTSGSGGSVSQFKNSAGTVLAQANGGAGGGGGQGSGAGGAGAGGGGFTVTGLISNFEIISGNSGNSGANGATGGGNDSAAGGPGGGIFINGNPYIQAGGGSGNTPGPGGTTFGPPAGPGSGGGGGAGGNFNFPANAGAAGMALIEF